MCIMFQSMLTMLVQRDWKLVSCTYDPELLKMQHNSVIGHISNAKCTTARHFLIFFKAIFVNKSFCRRQKDLLIICDRKLASAWSYFVLVHGIYTG